MPKASKTVTVHSCWTDPEGVDFNVEYHYAEQMDLLGDFLNTDRNELIKIEVFYQTHQLEDVLDEVLPELGMSLDTLKSEIWSIIEEEM